MINCPFCGASVKYAITESGTLPYEYVPRNRARKKLARKTKARWDLEQPGGNSHSYYRAMRATFERWAALERRRRVGKGRLGCALSILIFTLFVASCAIFSLVSTQARFQTPAGTPSASDLTATATANPDPYAARGLLTLDNLLNENSNAYWMDFANDSRPINQGCLFQDGSYVTSKDAQKTPGLRYCLADHTNFRNFAYQIQAQDFQGESGGLIFRESAPGKFYYFAVSNNGSYVLWLNTGDGTPGKMLTRGTSKVINRAGNQANILAVVADGPAISIYVNYVPLATVHDNTYSAGRIGTAVGGPDTLATEYLFNSAKVWTW
jgi:hypothetical protein